MSSNKCVRPESFDFVNLAFCCPRKGETSDGTSFSETRVRLKRSDGTKCRLYVATDTCSTFGIRKDSENGGYYIPLILADSGNLTDRQRGFVNFMKAIMYEFGCNPLPRLLEEDCLVLNARLDYDTECDEILTKCYERKSMEDKESTEEIAPKKCVSKRNCLVRAVIEIYGISVLGTTANLQMRVKTIVFSKPRSELRKNENFLDEI